MARKSKLHLPGGLYHVMLRGNGGHEIFFDEQARYHLYLLIQQEVDRYGHCIHGFCCMPNHIMEVRLEGCWRMIDFWNRFWAADANINSDTAV